MNSGTASWRECNPPAAGAASKRPSEDAGESPRNKRHASRTASAEDVDRHGRSALHLAAERGGVKRVKELIRKGADTRLRDRTGRTPLHRALIWNKEAAAELLAAADYANDVQDEDGRTPLHLAAEVGKVKIIIKLLAGGSRTRVQDRRGMTPLHQALCWNKEAAAELLAAADGKNEVQDENGRTPLHLAALKRFPRIVKKFVRSGTNPHVEDSFGEYPIQLALRLGRNGNISKMLLSLYALKGIVVDWGEMLLREEHLQFCIKELSRCEAEIQLMKHTQVPASSISYHHLVTRHSCRVASRLQTESIQRVSRWGCARWNFPVYADLIAFKLWMAEQRRVWTDRCLECFSLLSPPLPTRCAGIVLLCLSDSNMENILRAFQLQSRKRRSSCSW